MKAIFLLCLCIFATFFMQAQVEGPHSPGNASIMSLSGSQKTWDNAGNILSSDDSYATFSLSGIPGSYSDYLVASHFGFALPSGVIVTGIQVEVERSDSRANMSDYSIRLLKGGQLALDDLSQNINYHVADTYELFGGDSELWGEVWDYKDINDEEFGVAISARENNSFSGTLGRIDHVRITVYWEMAKTLPLKLLSFTATKKSAAVELKWTTSEETNMSHYEVQRSTDGRTFSTINSLTSHNNSFTTIYQLMDNAPVQGTAWYRLKMVGNSSNDTKHSNIIKVLFADKPLVQLWPSLLTAGQSIHISNPQREQLTVRFFNNSGQQVAVISTETNQLSSQSLSSQKGTVLYRITREDGSLAGTGRLILQ